MDRIKKILGIAIIFLGFNIWNNMIYDNNKQHTIEQIMFCLQGFKGFNKQCMGWILIHMPIQLYLAIKMSSYLHNFSIYYFMKKGTIKKLWQEELWISLKTAFFYYALGLSITFAWMFSQRNHESLSLESILWLIGICVLLTLSAVTFTFFVLLLEGLTANFQLSLTILIIVQIFIVMLSQNTNAGILPYPLSHTDIKNQIMVRQNFFGLLLQSILEMITVTVISFVAAKKRFENLVGNE